MTATPDPDDLARLQHTLGYRFRAPDLLQEALTHQSAALPVAGRSRRGRDYQRLEFLGDRVLGLVIADLLLRRFPDEDEGALAKRFAALVREEALIEVAQSLDLGRYLQLSAGEQRAGGRGSPSLQADACEAIIGALYLDGGLEPAARFVTRHWSERLGNAVLPPRDPKTALQEWAQGQGHALPEYTTDSADGPAHEPVFTITVAVAGCGAATARGPSKRAAGQAAAETLLRQLGVWRDS